MASLNCCWVPEAFVSIDMIHMKWLRPSGKVIHSASLQSKWNELFFHVFHCNWQMYLFYIKQKIEKTLFINTSVKRAKRNYRKSQFMLRPTQVNNIASIHYKWLRPPSKTTLNWKPAVMNQVIEKKGHCCIVFSVDNESENSR